MNRIDKVFQSRKNILSIYFTAGYPLIDDTLRIAKSIQEGGADMIEIGVPFSDPIADGPTIQHSATTALKNGMTLPTLFAQLEHLRTHVSLPVLVMGYMNPILQYGIEEFAHQCHRCGIDGLIIPDMPIHEYVNEYQAIFLDKGIHCVFLISPSTSEKRIQQIDELTSGFTYMVSSSSVTGAKVQVQDGQIEYYKRIESMKLKNPRLIGFGISNQETFSSACRYADGAIIGSAFINQLSEDASDAAIKNFIESIKRKQRGERG